MKKNNDNAKIIIKKINKPSIYMVDLSVLGKKDEHITTDQPAKFLKYRSKLTDFFKIKKNQSKLKSKLKEDTFFEYENKFLDNYENEQINLPKRYYGILRQLIFVKVFRIFFSFIKGVIDIVRKISFRLGWTIIFLLRFVYFFILGFLKIWQKLFYLTFSFFLKEKFDKKSCIWQEDYEQIRPLATENFIDSSFIKNNSNFLPKENQQTEDNKKKKDFKKRQYCKKIFNFNFFYFKRAIYFAFLMFVFILPFKALTYSSVLQDLGGRVLGVSEEAISDFKNAGTAAGNFDFYEAGEQFAEASDGFLQAQEEFDIVSSQLNVLSSIIPSHKLRLAANAKHILEAGEISAKIGQQISFIFDSFSYEKDKSIKNIFNVFFDNVAPLQKNLTYLHEVLSEINVKDLPREFQNDFVLLQDKIEQINKSFLELEDLLEKMKIFLGFENEKRYLLIFQNNSELRASGGFMGSFAIVDFYNGEITNMEIPKGGTYDTEAGYLDYTIAPRPLHIVNPLWHFWDANWWPDWKKTSRKLKWFYEKSGGSSVDGVIGITPTVVERFLEIIGPIDMEDEYGVTINAENFWEIIQTFAEEKPKNHPAYEPLPYQPKKKEGDSISNDNEKNQGYESKKIIGDLIEKIKIELPKRLNKEVFLSLVASLELSLSEKHLLFYFDDWLLQSKFEELGWAGRTKKTSWDYLMVVNTNISGAKSDRKIKQEINHQSEVLSDGSIVDTLKITRTHTGHRGDRFTGVKNLDWMRIYLPLGSQFVEASGFWPPDEALFEDPDPSWRHDPDLKNSEENFIRDRKSWTKIYNEGDKTVFANWVQVDPGESAVVVVKYILPFKLKSSISQSNALTPFALLVEKQPGADSCKFSSHLILPDNLSPVWQYPENFNIQTNGWIVEDELSIDKFWAITIK